MSVRTSSFIFFGILIVVGIVFFVATNSLPQKQDGHTIPLNTQETANVPVGPHVSVGQNNSNVITNTAGAYQVGVPNGYDYEIMGGSTVFNTTGYRDGINSPVTIGISIIRSKETSQVITNWKSVAFLADKETKETSLTVDGVSATRFDYQETNKESNCSPGSCLQVVTILGKSGITYTFHGKSFPINRNEDEFKKAYEEIVGSFKSLK